MASHCYQILLVEDDDSHAELIRRCFALAPLPTAIRRLADGEQAWQLLLAPERRGNQPPPHFDLIILDQHLPKVHGLDILKELDKRGITRRVPVVIFSTSTAAEDREFALSRGARAYISKPVGYDDFLAAIQEIARFLTETRAQTG